MKKIICLLLLAQSSFIMAQKKTFTTIAGEKIIMNTKINNGLSDTVDGEIQLGGALLKPSVITTTSVNTLSVQGLQTGSNADNVLVADANGVLKWIPRSAFAASGPWYDVATKNAATLNTQDIYQMSSKMGIGTATPHAQLHLGNSVSNRKVILYEDADNDNQFYGIGVQSNLFKLQTSAASGTFTFNNGTSSTTSNEMMRVNATGLGVGTTAPSNKLHVKADVNPVKFEGLQPGAVTDNIVVADANGVLKTISSAGLGGDNLGNHTATQDLAMSSKNITGAANVTASGTVTGANITATTKTTTPAAQITTGAGAGKVAVSDALGNLTWTDPATIAAKGDNLGNHTATQNLDMTNKDIDNIKNANIKSSVTLFDQTTSNTGYFSLNRKNGVFGLYNSKSALYPLTIDENDSKTSISYVQIKNGTDNVRPSAGYIATSLDDTGNVVWTNPATITAKGDNLGNHTATQNLDMSSKNINNISTATIKYEGKFTDRVAENTNTFSLYKNAGSFGIYNSKLSKNALTIDEATGFVGIGTTTPRTPMDFGSISGSNITDDGGRKISLYNNAAGTDFYGLGIAPAMLTFSAAANPGTKPAMVMYSSGQLVLYKKDTSTDSQVGINLKVDQDGNVANAGTLKIGLIPDGAVTESILTADANGNVKKISSASLAAGSGDNLGNHTATQDLAMSGKNINAAKNITGTGLLTTNTAIIAKGTDGIAPQKGAVATSADSNGNIIWVKAEDVGAKVYNSASVAPGGSVTITLDNNPVYATYMITSSNACGISMMLNLATYSDGISFIGGSGGAGVYTATNQDAYSKKWKFTAVTLGCADGANSTEYNVTVEKSGNKIIITNNGNVNKTYSIRQRL